MSIQDIPKKKRGRKPTTGRGAAVVVRLHEPLLGAIDAAAAKEGVGRAELIRRVIHEWLMARGFLAAKPVTRVSAEATRAVTELPLTGNALFEALRPHLDQMDIDQVSAIIPGIIDYLNKKAAQERGPRVH